MLVKTKLFFKRVFVFMLCSVTIFLSGCGFPSPSIGYFKNAESPVVESEIKNPTTDIRDYFSGVIICTEPENDTLFYDKVDKNEKTFVALLERQFSLMAEHIDFALKAFYINSALGKEKQSTYIDTIEFNKFTLISPGENEFSTKARSCTHGTVNLIDLNCGECISWMAGERSDLKEINPFNFTRAIDGGYIYNETGEFGTEINTARKWIGADNLTMNNVKMQLAKIVATGEYSALGTVTSGQYNAYLNSINHLGFTESTFGEEIAIGEVDVIKEFILNNIIGSANVEYDDNLFPSGNDKIILNPGGDPFEDNPEKHYYKSYRILVNKFMDKAVTISKNGKYPNYGSNDFAVYLKFPRINAMYKHINEFYDFNVSPFEPVLESAEKIKSIVFLPEVNTAKFYDRNEQLVIKYGDFYKDWPDKYAFYLPSDWFMNFVCANDAVLDEFVLKLKFNVMAQGVEILDSYLPLFPIQTRSDFITSDLDMVAMSPTKLIEHGVTNKLIEENTIRRIEAEKFMSIYNISPASSDMQQRRLTDYDGVVLYDPVWGSLDSEFFKNDKLVAGSDLFQIAPKTNLQQPETFIAGADTFFNRGNNCFQIFLEYYNMQYEPITTQDVNIVYMTSIDGFLEALFGKLNNP